MRSINLIFLVILLAVITLLGGVMHLVHGVQLRRNATALLERAEREAASNDLEKAEQSLKQYLSVRREDGPAWKRYAQIVDERDPSHQRRERVFLVYEEALRYNAGDAQLERRCADLALGMARYSDAQRHLTNLAEIIPKDSQGQPPAAEMAELEDLLGQCERGLARFEAAEQYFLKAVAHDPTRVDCYDRLARLRRTELRQAKAADGTIEEMVAKNPKSGRAYIDRWRYFQEFLKAPEANDLRKALELAPDDPEVLYTAAVLSEQNQDLASARRYFEKGRALDPKHADFALGLARLQAREQHLDRAEAVLRQCFKTYPSVEVAFALAQNLILQDKIDGRDEAKHYMGVLRSAGQGDTLVPFLEAQILFQRKKWSEAIPRLEMARALLASKPQLTAQLDLMLVECYSQVGFDEQRLDALRQAAQADQSPESTRMEFVEALARSGKFDQAIATLMPLTVRAPERRIDLVRLLLRRAIRQPKDRRNWQDVEKSLQETEKLLPQAGEPLVLLRLDMLGAQDRLDDARSLLSSALAKDPRNLRYRLALARVTQRQGQGPAALQVLDQAEKDLGPSLDLNLARLDYWGQAGGDEAKAAVAKLASMRQQIPASDRPAFLDWLGGVELRLGQLELARQYGRELAALQPKNLGVRLGLFDMAVRAGDRAEAAGLVDEIREIEGDKGTSWRFARAALLIDGVRRGTSHDLDEARRLASDISQCRPEWARAFALNGELAELAGSTDQAIAHYLHAVELGDVQPSLVRKLVGLLNERNRFDEIDRVARLLRDQGTALGEVTLVQALGAIRKQDFDRAITLARQVFSESSTNPSDHLTLGRVYMSAGQTDAAGKEFRRAVELGPGVPDAWLTYVNYLTQTKHVDHAKTAIEAARKALPADRSAFTLAQCYSIVGDGQQAEKLIEEVVKNKPGDPAALRFAAVLDLGQNRLEKVNDRLTKLERIGNASVDDKAWVNRTRVALLLTTGRHADRDRALKLVDQNLTVNAESVEDQQLKATTLAFEPARRGEAVKILEQLGRANRLDANLRFLLAQLYLIERNEEKYQSEMHKLLDQKVRNPQHLAHFVNYWIGRNHLNQADRWLAELKKVEPQGLPALESEARLLDSRKRKPQLLALLEARGREVPDQVGAVADLLSRYGFPKEAEAAYNAFIVREPRQPERVLQLAQFLSVQARVAESVVILNKAWKTCRPEKVAAVALPLYDAPSAGEAEKRQIEVWVTEAVRKRPEAVALAAKLAFIWIREGRFDEAEGLLRRLLATNRDNVDVLNGLAWLLAMRDQGNTSDALALISHAIEIQGDDGSLLDTRAIVLIQSGQPAKAVDDLRAAQRLNPKNANPVVHLARAYQMTGQREDAKKLFRQAGELGWKIAACDPLERAVMEKLRQDLGFVAH